MDDSENLPVQGDVAIGWIYTEECVECGALCESNPYSRCEKCHVPFQEPPKPSTEEALANLYRLNCIRDYEEIVFPLVRSYLLWVTGNEPKANRGDRLHWEYDLGKALDYLAETETDAI